MNMNNYDITKYHIILTESKNKNSYLLNKFRELSNNSFLIPNYYKIYDTNRLQNIILHKNNNEPVESKRIMQNNPIFLSYVSSFIFCLNIARLNDWPYIFILRDDITYIDDDFNSKINNLEINESDYIIFDDYNNCKINNILVTKNNFTSAIKNINQQCTKTFNHWLHTQNNFKLVSDLIKL